METLHIQYLTVDPLLFVSHSSSQDKSSSLKWVTYRKDCCALLPSFPLPHPPDKFVLKFPNGSRTEVNRVWSVVMAAIRKMTKPKKWHRVTFDLFLLSHFQTQSVQVVYHKLGCSQLLKPQKLRYRLNLSCLITSEENAWEYHYSFSLIFSQYL